MLYSDTDSPADTFVILGILQHKLDTVLNKRSELASEGVKVVVK